MSANAMYGKVLAPEISRQHLRILSYWSELEPRLCNRGTARHWHGNRENYLGRVLKVVLH
jgi:hypothetical protein